MQSDKSKILSAANAISSLHDKVHDLVRHRSRSANDRDNWAAACEQFHKQFHQLFFPDGESGWQSFLSRSPEGVEAAISYLEADPYCFRSGYFKQVIWHKLKRCLLSSNQLERIEVVALSYLSKPLLKEFWQMVRYVRFRGSQAFWQEVASQAESAMGPRQARSVWLLLARQNYPIRAWVDKKFRQLRDPRAVYLLHPEVDVTNLVQESISETRGSG